MPAVGRAAQVALLGRAAQVALLERAAGPERQATQAARTAVLAAYDSSQISDQQVLESLPVLAKLLISGDAVVSTLSQGMRKRAWVGNCVAVGESAFSLELLDALQLHIAHNCITQLMTQFPVGADAFPEAELYDRVFNY